MKEQVITNFFSSRMGCATNTPPIRTKMRSVLLLFALLLGIGQVWAVDPLATLPNSQVLTTDFANVGSDANVKIKTSSANTYTNPLRFYANVTTTIQVASGYTIKSVTYEASSTGNYVTNAQNATVTPNVTPTVSGKNVTWSFSGETTEFTFEPGTQTRANSITVVYSSTGSGSQQTAVSIDPADGTVFYSENQTITLSGTEGADFYYTLDGTDPTSSSTKYTDPFTITETKTIKAIAIKDAQSSGVATATITKGEPITTYDINFETNLATPYVNWSFTNAEFGNNTITAHDGTYYGTTGGKATASIATKDKIEWPGTFTCYVSKQSDNTTSSTWYIQVSEDGSNWNNVKDQSATSMVKGEWTEFTADLKAYHNVYVRLYYSGTTAVRNVDDISLTMRTPIESTILWDDPSNGSFVVKNGVADVTNEDEVQEYATLTITTSPAAGYKVKSVTVEDEDENEVEVTLISANNYQFVMPAKGTLVYVEFEMAKTLTGITLSGTHRTSFWVGETFSSEGLIVTAHFANADDEVVTPTSVSEPTMNVAGDKTITVSYTEGTTTKTVDYTINVKALPTEANPATVAEIRDLYDRLGYTSNVYVRGTIYNLQTFYTSGNDAGKYTYWITDEYDSESEPNHSNEFEIFKGTDFNGTVFISADDLEKGQEVVVKGDLTTFNSTYEFNATGVIISRPKVLKSIALSGTYSTEFTQGDEFSSEGLVVTASYNYGENATVTPTTITGYNMSATGNQMVTVSYTESDVTKTATYNISVAAPDNCEHKATISKGEEVNGTFALNVSGELCLDELEGNKTSTVLTASPALHYHLKEVTATVGTVGTINDNSCTISEINANTTITAVFAEDDKATLTFAKGDADGAEDAPDNIENYAGDETLPDCPFTYIGHYFTGWKKGETEEIYQPGAYTITAADVTAGTIAFTAQWAEGYVFEWVADGHGYTNEYVLGSVNSTPIAIEFAKATANYDPKYYTNDKTARFYNGGTLTITAPADHLISKIEFTTGDWGATASKGSLVEKTWTGLAEEVVFTGTAICKVKSLKVYYKAGVASTLEIADIELAYGDEVTILPKTVTPAAAVSQITYDIKEGGDDCITLTGNRITAKSITGTATIVATIPDASEYLGTSVEFTVSVSALDSRYKAEITSLTSTSGTIVTVKEGTHKDKEYISYAAYQGNGTTPPAADGVLKIYKPSAGNSTGGYVVISAVKGCTIDEVQVTNANSKATTIGCSTTSTLATTGTAYAKEATVPFTNLNSSIVYIDDIGSERADITKITVYYTGEPVTVHHLNLSGDYSTEFEQGEDFDHAGLVVTACYDVDETDTEDVTDLATVSTPNMNVAGEQTITVSYGGKDASYTITVNAAEGADDLSGTWSLVTDAADLMAGMKVIIAGSKEAAVYTMGDQKNNNRSGYASSVDGSVLTPNFNTKVLTLVRATDNTFYLQTSDGKYLYNASSSSNSYLRTKEDKDASWTIEIDNDNNAIIKSVENTNRQIMRFNYNNGNTLFNCYASGQEAIKLYAKQFDYEREIAQGVLSTTCLPNGGQIFGASIFEIAYMDYEADGTTPHKIYFDEVEGGIMEAGMPYVVLANEGATKFGVYYTDNENKAAQSKDGLVGYIGPGRSLDENEYFIYDNKFFYVSATDATNERIHISNNRAYINLPEVPGYNNEPVVVPAPRRRVSLGNGANAPAVATGMENVQANEAPRKVLINGELFILRGEKIYDAKGQLVK